jgi:hypothetical protein
MTAHRAFLYTTSILFWLSFFGYGVACTSSVGDERSKVHCTLLALAGTISSTEALSSINYSLNKIAFSDTLGNKSSGFSELRTNTYPIFAYEHNVNGGNPRKNLEVGPLIFNSNSEYYRYDALTFGIGFNANYRYVLVDGFYGSLKIGANLQTPLSNSDKITNNSVEACISKQIKGWNFLDVCLDQSTAKKTLSDSKQKQVFAGFTNYFSTKGDQTSSVKLGLGRELNNEEYTNAKLSFDRIDSLGEGTRYDLGLKKSKFNDGLFGRSIGYSIEKRIKSKAVRLNISRSYDSLSPLLGVDRDEWTNSLSIAMPIGKRLYLSIGAKYINSSIDYFDDQQYLFSFSFR